ncbi:MAG: hypothetical protein ABEJ03_01875 [Candidatus Nanohaloarchaea archaeon]
MTEESTYGEARVNVSIRDPATVRTKSFLYSIEAFCLDDRAAEALAVRRVAVRGTKGGGISPNRDRFYLLATDGLRLAEGSDPVKILEGPHEEEPVPGELLTEDEEFYTELYRNLELLDENLRCPDRNHRGVDYLQYYAKTPEETVKSMGIEPMKRVPEDISFS